MPLQPGTTLGPYSVTAKIGEEPDVWESRLSGSVRGRSHPEYGRDTGGMGEVYRARDTKLDRDVALKVLPEAFTSDPDRLARFEREAKVLASLNCLRARTGGRSRARAASRHRPDAGGA